jgi:hypothetical protein
MPNPKQRFRIGDFSGGLVTYPSSLDIKENQFQKFEEVENRKIGRIEKVKGAANVTASKSTSDLLNGQGYYLYRTGWDASNVQTSTLWHVLYRKTGSGDITLNRYDNADGTSGNWAEIFDETTWTDIIGDEQISSENDRRFEGASNWANAAGPNAFNAYDETTGGVLTVTPDEDASNRQYAVLDGANWEDADGDADAMVVGRTYRLSYTLTVSAYTKGTLSVGFANTSHALQDVNTYTTTSSSATRTLDFVYGGTTDDAEIIINAATSSVFTAVFDNFSIKEVIDAEVDMFAHNEVLRISDGNLGNSNNISQWYGHIKREFWGNGTASGITYGTNKSPDYYQPAQNESFNNWEVYDTELKPPIVVKMNAAFDALGLNASVAINNDDFEDGFTGGLADNWSNQGSVTVVQYTADPYAGSNAQQIKYTNGTGQNIYQAVSVTVGKQYRLACYIKTLSGTLNSKIGISGTQVGSLDAATTAITTVEGWQRVFVDFIAPTSTVYIKLLASVSSVHSGVAVFDNITLTSLGGGVGAEREVGIFSYEPRHPYASGTILENDDHYLWPNAIRSETFSEDDKYTVTYVYDHIQETELGKTADGEIGVSGFEVKEQGPDEFKAKQADGTTDNLVNDASFDMGDTTVTVDVGGAFNIYTYIRIGQEIMLVTGISTNVLTVVRGQLGTSDVGHEDNSEIYIYPSPHKARAINLVIYTGASNASWNRRITAINLYWKPKDEVDWYLAGTFDVEEGFADSDLAVLEPTAINVESNWGHWTRCPDAAGSEVTVGAIEAGSTDRKWLDTDYFVNTAVNDIAVAVSTAKSPSDYSVILSSLSSMWGKVSAKVTTDDGVEFDANMLPVSRSGTRASDPETYYVITSTPRTDVVTNWYFPFDGIKAMTYQSFTGRIANQTVPAIRWKTSVVAGDRVFYGNIDTKDENEQTVRERSRVYWSPIFKPDEITTSGFKDFGKNDGDEIVSLEELDGRLYVLKDRNIYILNITSGSELNWQLERHYRGFGCSYRSASIKTPYGIVCCDFKQITLITPQRILELSLPIRAEWQALTFDNPAIGYSGVQKEIVIVPDTSPGNTAISGYRYNFDRGSISKATLDATVADDISNFQIGDNLEPFYARSQTAEE